MDNTRHQHDIWAMESCTKRIMEATSGLGQMKGKGATKYFFLFDCWFALDR